MGEERFCKESDRVDYFAGCELVVRAPGWYFWAGELSNMFRQPALVHQLNLWVYAGIEFWDEERFDITLRHAKRTAPTYKPFENLRTTDYLEANDVRNDLKEGIKRAIELLGQWKMATPKGRYFRIKIFSDIPLAVGMNSSASIAACTSMLLYASLRSSPTKKIQPEEMNAVFAGLFSQSPEDLLQNPDFLELFHTAWYFDNAIHSLFKSGVGPMASLLRPAAGQELLLYIIDRGDMVDETEFFECPKNYSDHISKMKQFPIYAERFPIPEWFTRQIGFSLFYSGTFQNIKDGVALLIGKQRLNRKRIADRFKTLAERFQTAAPHFEYPLQKYCLRDVQRNGKDDLANCEIYASALGFLSLKIIDCLLDKDSKPDDFFTLIRENYMLMKAYINVEESTLGDAKRVILKQSKRESTGYKAYIKLIGAGAGGNLLCYALFGNLKNKINAEFYKRAFEYDHDGDRDTVDGVVLHYTSDRQGWIRGLDAAPVYNLNGGELRDIVHLKDDLIFSYAGRGIVTCGGQNIPLDETNFAIFLYLAAARKYGKNDGYLHKYDDLLAPRPGAACYFQTKQKVEDYFRNVYDLFRASRRRDSKVYLAIDPENLKFDKSLVDFVSSHYDKLAPIVNRARRYEGNLLIYRDHVQSEDFKKSFMTHYKAFIRNTQLVLNTINYLKWKLTYEDEYLRLKLHSETINANIESAVDSAGTRRAVKPGANKR